MEKLIELLNEYEKTLGDYGFRRTFYDKGYHRGEEGYYYSELQLVSKSFGFIKRLYDNDKINKDTKFLISVNVENQKNGMGYVKEFEGYESLLMLLAIQDEPIEFLIQLLN